MFVYYIHIKYIHINGHLPILCSLQKAKCIFNQKQGLGIKKKPKQSIQIRVRENIQICVRYISALLFFVFEYAIRRVQVN
jgi:hypothetical protein